MNICPNCEQKITGENILICSNCGFEFQQLGKKEELIKENVPVKEEIMFDFSKMSGATTSFSDGTGSKKMRKWGWGWYILFGFLTVVFNKYYNVTDTNAPIAYIIGITISLFLYFYLRKNFFTTFNKPWLRSFLSGIISYFIGAFIMGFLSRIYFFFNLRIKIFEDIS
jgi:hypothetical protein